MSLGSNLRSARKEAGYTQKELAALIGAKHNSISNWENDQNKPDPDTIELLCGVLRVSPNELLLDKKSAPAQSEGAPEWISMYNSLSEESQAMVRERIQTLSDIENRSKK